MSQNISDLFRLAQEDGALSNAAVKALTVVDIGQEIEAALGVDIDDVQASEVVLVTMMPDDSGSIRFAGNSQIMRDGHNEVLDALIASKQQDNILAHTRYLNGHVLFPYVPLNQAVRMDQKNYNPSHGTPLYDQTTLLLGTVVAKTQEFLDNGVQVRTVTLIITDGNDEHSTRAKPATVATIVKDMLMTENHIIAAMGISDGSTDFRRIFKEMGIRDEWVLTPGNKQGDIRKAFNLFSKSAVRASQSAVSFSQTAMGGFGQ
jgi:hypothetical protein